MLTRERDEMRRERDLLQHEVSRLATCLQFSHMGSVAAAANVVAMSQQVVAQQGTSNNPVDVTGPHYSHPNSTAVAVASAAATLSSISQFIPLPHASVCRNLSLYSCVN